MLNLKKFFLVVFSLVLLLPIFGRAAANPVELYFFEGQGCQHCAKMKSFLEGLKVDYPNVTVKDFEVYFNKENQELFQKMAAAYGADSNGVPTIFIGEEVIVGENYEKLKNAVEKCSTKVCPSPADKLAAANIDINSNTSQAVAGGNEVVGWIVVGAVVIFVITLIIFISKKK